MIGDRIHPGEILLEELLERGMVPNDFAEKWEFDRQEILSICKRQSSITAEMAGRLSETLGTSVDLWLNLQKSYDDSKPLGDV